MAEEIDDNEFFQQDFTTASEWEIFNARLEEIFHEWKLPFVETQKPLEQNQLFRAEWEVKSEIIFFADVELSIKRYRAIFESSDEEQDEITKKKESQAHVDLTSVTNNFNIYDLNTGKIHPLAAWYGLRDFVVIEPTGNPIVNESQYRVLLSSACMTIAESNTEIPVFVHIMPHELNVYLGVCECPSMRTNFDIVALETIPPTCKYLSGLLNMFKGKIGVHYIEPATVSVRLSFSLTDFISSEYCPQKRSPFAEDASDEEFVETGVESSETFGLPYGVSMDPVNEIILHCTWPQIPENVIIDSPVYSNLNPSGAPNWSIQANFKQKPIYYLTEMCTEYLKLCENGTVLGAILGSAYHFNQSLEGGNPLDLLTESKIPSISTVLTGRSNSKASVESKPERVSTPDGPLASDDLMNMLYFMFPDAQPNSLHPYNFGTVEFDPLKIKSALPDSLVFRLSLLLAICNTEFGGMSAVAHLWAEFTQEMRYRVERCIQIPGVASGFPDSRTSLLHQKLQMLNICMERRRIREGGLPFAMTTSTKEMRAQKDDSEEEQFFDCSSDEDDKAHPAWNKPEGRLSKLGNLTLIDSDEPLYIPITQEPVPKTEDQLEDDAEVMLKLGPGSELCAQMMSASLLSDMESFKAANPNGKLEDFIRWYSPRDWIEETDESGNVKGRLSQRMLIPGNTWQTVWKTAKPVPARRQKRLFDDTKEAEKALHYFETRTIGQICQLTLAPLFNATILKIKDELQASDLMEQFNEHFERIVLNLCKLSRETWTISSSLPLPVPSRKKWEALLQDIANLEHMNIQAMSLIRKLFGKSDESNLNLENSQKEIITSLLKGLEVELNEAGQNPISVRILDMFNEAKLSKSEFGIEETATKEQQPLPEPFRKEFIIRLSGKTVDKGPGGPQFLRAILDKHLRLCGAFTENTTFL